MGAIGPAGDYWCWINLNDMELSKAEALILSELYIPLWISAITILFIIYKVIHYIRNATAGVSIAFVNRLKMYPFIMIICWIPPTIHRIYNFCTDRDSTILIYLHIIFTRGEGLLHVLAYGMNESVTILAKEAFFGKAQKSERNSAIREQELAKSGDGYSGHTNGVQSDRAILANSFNAVFDRRTSEDLTQAIALN